MKTVCERNQCAGCMACQDICPESAIAVEDSAGACSAVIDETKCIRCGACYAVCPNRAEAVLRSPALWKEGWAADGETRRTSASGGMAAAIERAFVERGGTVCSCAWDGEAFSFAFAERVDELEAFRGSRYVRSNPAGAYKRIADQAASGKKVLFVGLPCQAAAVRRVVGENPNVYTVDLICHGAPSPEVLGLFLREHGVDPSRVGRLDFREKTRFGLRADGRRVAAVDAYMTAFFEAATYTESCYTCRYARLERAADMTLGDSWGSKRPRRERKRGISLILVQTPKGRELLDMADAVVGDVDLDEAVRANQQLRCPAARPARRDAFIKAMEAGFERAVRRFYPVAYAKGAIKALGCGLRQAGRRAR